MDKISELIASIKETLAQIKSTFEIYEGFQYQRDHGTVEWQNFR